MSNSSELPKWLPEAVKMARPLTSADRNILVDALHANPNHATVLAILRDIQGVTRELRGKVAEFLQLNDGGLVDGSSEADPVVAVINESLAPFTEELLQGVVAAVGPDDRLAVLAAFADVIGVVRARLETFMKGEAEANGGLDEEPEESVINPMKRMTRIFQSVMSIMPLRQIDWKGVLGIAQPNISAIKLGNRLLPSSTFDRFIAWVKENISNIRENLRLNSYSLTDSQRAELLAFLDEVEGNVGSEQA